MRSIGHRKYESESTCCERTIGDTIIDTILPIIFLSNVTSGIRVSEFGRYTKLEILVQCDRLRGYIPLAVRKVNDLGKFFEGLFNVKKKLNIRL